MEERFEVESRVEPEEPPRHWLIPAVAISTAVLAVLAAYSSFEAGEAVHHSLAHLNQAGIYQAQASDQWSFYQAKGIKRHVFEVQRDVLLAGAALPASAVSSGPSAQPVPPTGARGLAARYDKEVKRYAKEQETIRKDAEALERKRELEIQAGERFDALHQRLGLAVAFFQIGIVVCSVAAIVRRAHLWYGGLLAGTIGAVYLLQAILAPGTAPPAAGGHGG